MNFVRSRLSVGNLFGQRVRGMCNKLPEAKPESPPAAPAQEHRPLFKTPGYRPSNLDRKILVWAGRFKSAEQIPDTVSFEMIDNARNKIRVKAAYVMMALTIGACLVMVVMGKKCSQYYLQKYTTQSETTIQSQKKGLSAVNHPHAAGRNESLTVYNLEKKAKWREEFQKEKTQ